MVSYVPFYGSHNPPGSCGSVVLMVPQVPVVPMVHQVLQVPVIPMVPAVPTVPVNVCQEQPGPTWRLSSSMRYALLYRMNQTRT